MSNFANVLDINNLSSVVARRCERFGIRVVWDKWAQTASTDGRGTITLPAPSLGITDAGLREIYRWIIHECGHNIRRSAFDILNRNQPCEQLAYIYNIIEDDSLERQLALDYYGDRKVLSQGWDEQTAKTLAEIKSKGIAPCDEEQENIWTVFGLQSLARLDWSTSSDLLTHELISLKPESVQQKIVEMVHEGFVEKIRQATTPEDTWEVSKEIFEYLFSNLPPQQQESEGEGNGEQEGGNGNGSGDSDEGEEQEDKGDCSEDPEDTDGDSEETNDRPEGISISWKDIVHDDHKDKNVKGGTSGITWVGLDSTEDETPCPASLINVVDLKKRANDSRRNIPYYSQYLPTENQSSTALANKVRRFIQAQTRTFPKREQYRGKLDKRSLVKLAMPPIDGGEWNKKLFYTLENSKKLDTALVVLIDWSGSMSGRKMKYAADAAQRINNIFNRQLRVPTLFAMFSDARSPCDIGIAKTFNERTCTDTDLAKRFASFDYYSSANADGDAVLWAYRELMKRPEKRKLMIILSDGQPAGGFGSSWTSGDSLLQKVAKAIEEEGKVDLYALGICNDSVARYYTNHQVVYDPSEINEALFTILKDGVHY